MKKIIFQWGFSCKTCKNSYEFLAPQDKILARFLTLAENTNELNHEYFEEVLGNPSNFARQILGNDLAIACIPGLYWAWIYMADS